MSLIQRRSLKVAVFLLALLPLGLLLWSAFRGQLSANPIDDITDATGTWTLRFVMITLAIRPARRIPALGWVGGFRRMAGLFAFFYGVLHLTTYVYLDQFFDLEAIAKDVVKRPFITAGVTAFLLMVPLAVTSTQGMIRRLGGARWKMLHRLIYATAVCGVLHYLWLVKADRQRPLTYGVLLAFLLAYRFWEFWERRRHSRAP
jgi:sulfoxide reductase heme-binding subunit YedZ